ncbi:MAG: lactococcin 972 family bacteriocin [Actinomycetota bacterium]|nr:lactococcin 972 family bacteriocin [Actinomycetota bacterium]
MTTKIKIRLAAAIVLALSLIGTLGTGVAAAGSGGGYVGGGYWIWENISGIYARSEYHHPTKYHSATACVGNSCKKVYASSGNWAKAAKWGVGTTRVYWNTY